MNVENKKGKPAKIYDGKLPLTEIIKCPKCGLGTVIMRTTNTYNRLIFNIKYITYWYKYNTSY